MMTIIAAAMSIVLAAVSLVHFYWAFGGLWPGHDAKSLADAVIGDPRLAKLPPAHVTLIVAVLIAIAAAWPLVAPHMPLLALAKFGSFLLAGVFLLRGVAGYAPFFRRRHSLQPFAKFNRLLYSPLCLLLGAGFIYVAIAVGTE
jgi:hypothetical protein